MNFKEWYNLTLAKEHTIDKLMASEHGWDACKREVLKILEQNKELESVSYSGKECYKIYGNVIEKIKKL